MPRAENNLAMCVCVLVSVRRKPRPNRLGGRAPFRADQERPGGAVPPRPRPQSQPLRRRFARWPAQSVARLAAAQQHGRVMVRDTAAVLHQRRTGQHGDVAVRESADRASQVRLTVESISMHLSFITCFFLVFQHVGVSQHAPFADGGNRWGSWRKGRR